MLPRNPFFAILITLLGFEPSSNAESMYVPDDIQTFVSRPDIEAPRLDVKTYLQRQVSSGLWFLPIYDNAGRPEVWSNQTRNIGPYIYDTYGNLVWSGSSLFRRRPVFDLRPCAVNGTDQLSMIVQLASKIAIDDGLILGDAGTNLTFQNGANLFLDASYRVSSKVPMVESRNTFNIHEFKILDDGKTALVITVDRKYWSGEDPSTGTEKGGLLVGNGFQAVNVDTGEILFEWQSFNHVPPWGSYRHAPREWGDDVPGSEVTWDYFHMNSVDRDDNGDYLVSSRYMYTIFKISGVSGDIIWSLGGANSSFDLLPEGVFNFSHQHDARFKGRSEDGTQYYMTFLNNAADEMSHTSNHSTALSVALDMKAMTATVVGQWDRPDGKFSISKGNMQVLSNGNVFVGWGVNGYLTEFTDSGELIQEARFLGDRYVTYRIYKYDFKGAPSIDELVVKSFWHEITDERVTKLRTRVYISWNGATEVARWRIYNSQNGSPADDDQWIYVNTIPKSGFETVFENSGNLDFVRVQALDSHGRSLGFSSPYLTVPRYWNCASDNCTQAWFEAGRVESEKPVSVMEGRHPKLSRVIIGAYRMTASELVFIFGSIVWMMFMLSVVSTTVLGVMMLYRKQRATTVFDYGMISEDTSREIEQKE